MQQTEKYKLNLIEDHDPFLPEGLNQNTQKVEDVLSENLEGMDLRVTVMEARKIVVGKYVGTYNVHNSATVTDQDIILGFRPKFGFIWDGTRLYFHWAGCPKPVITPTDDGFHVEMGMNIVSFEYHFMLFG